MDILFINPGDRKKIFQSLGQNLTSIEPPYLILSFATYLKNLGYSVGIIDSNAENVSPEETAQKVVEINPKLIAIIVYGNQPSASTQNMGIAGRIAREIKKLNSSLLIVMGGLHPSALPQKTLYEEDIDFVIEGEEQIPLKELIKTIKTAKDFNKVPGLWYFEKNKIKKNSKPNLIKNLDEYMLIADWKMIDLKKYRAHNWHCFDNIKKRSPYAAIYTSLGCPFNCVFCCINAPFGKHVIRYRNPEIVVQELEILNKKYRVRNIKIIDEMFVLHENHYMKIVDLIIKKKLDLNIWCYARVDTIKETNLKRMKQAGINWLALGIESANPDIRDGASKKLRVKDIKKIVKMIQYSGIRVIGNFIFGLPNDTLETMEETLEMARELNCEFVNFYCAMAYPGSKLYEIAIKEGWDLPDTWEGYSQHSYETKPLPTRYLSAMEVLKFRDEAFYQYFTNPKYLNMIEEKFGDLVKEHIRSFSKIKLKRKILEV